jgi:hypothetical protein
MAGEFYKLIRFNFYDIKLRLSKSFFYDEINKNTLL